MKSNQIPGPNAYSPAGVFTNKKGGISLSGRPQRLNKQEVPGVGAYDVSEKLGCKNNGVIHGTLKYRGGVVLD